MRTFFIPVDLRNRAEMTGFLKNHFRYFTMNSWNRSTSYACNLKIHRLGLEAEYESKLYEMLGTQEFYYAQHMLLDEFGRQHEYRWQAGMNGRNSGYLVLYQGELKPSGYRSFCTECGQKNFRAASETDCICGACRKPTRINFRQPDTLLTSYPGRSTDMDEDFEDWGLEELRMRVRLVQSLDQLADRMVAQAILLCRSCKVVEETVFVPKVQKILVKGV